MDENANTLDSHPQNNADSNKYWGCELIKNDNANKMIVPTESKTLKDDDIIITIQMYYNAYDRYEGVGFYPQCSIVQESSIDIDFKLFVYKLNTYGWIQNNGPVIYGVTKFNGTALLDALNKKANQNALVISNSGGRIIYPMMYNSTYYILENYSK
jgi:hypothetical protein